MSRIDIPKQDSLFGPWASNFASVAAANVTTLQLTTGQATALTTLSNKFETAYTNSQVAKVNAKGKVGAKNIARGDCEEMIRSVAKVINASNTIPETLKADLGITISPSPIGPVTSPSSLVANGFDNGQNKLSWKRNGNAPRTAFLIEVKYGATGPWQFVAITSKTRFVHEGQTPGQMTTYRVFAQRNDFQSGASNLAVIYEDSVTEVITLPQAA